MKKILLTQEKFALVDEEDFEYLNQWKWHFCKSGYAVRNCWPEGKSGVCKTIRMHRVIMNTPRHLQVDHINGNRLDNRKINLRNCTQAQNAMNKGADSKTNRPYKGVSWWEYNGRPGKWIAQIRHNRKSIHIGVYKSANEAALAYNIKAKELFGEYARLNRV